MKARPETNLLEQQLGRIRDRQLRHLLRALAVGTPSVVSHQPALGTRVDLEFVGRDHETLEQQLRRAIPNKAVTLHLPQSQPTFAGATFSGLAR